MALLTNVTKLAGPLAGAVLIEPLLNLFAPSVKPLISQFIQSDEAKRFLRDLANGVAQAGSGVCTEFLGNRAEELLEALKVNPRLEEALIVASRKAFADMGDELRKKYQYSILNSFDQFFTDWDEKLKQIQNDDLSRKELLIDKHFADLFHQWPSIEIDDAMWWFSVKAELASWTTYSSIPTELDNYLHENLLTFANTALTSTLSLEKYKEAWNEFHQSLGKKILSVLKELEKHLAELKELVKVANGQFIQDKNAIEFPLRKLVDSLIKDLSAKDIYIPRKAILTEEEIEVNGLHDMVDRDGYYLLAAPAGSGKSTLMAHWINDFVSTSTIVGSKPPVKLCYYFYSKQEGTNDHNKGLTVLSDQLLKILNIQANVSSFNPATIDSIIPNTLELNHSARLILILDGLDEAGEPSTTADFLSLFKRILPRELGKNITVILTVRDSEGPNSLQYYREHFNLPFNPLVLPEVNAIALASYLSNATDDRLKEKVRSQSFLTQLIEKTEGLAIYVHYLLDELSQTPEDEWARTITALPKGFEQYVRLSLPTALSDQRQWEDALCFIASTQIPLEKRDLVALTSLSGNSLRETDFDRVRWNIRRWLRNEGAYWSFSHLKIGEVFQKLYVHRERLKFTEHLLAYCADWRKNKSRFVLQHYADLLRIERKEEELYELAGEADFRELQRNKLVSHPTAPLRTLQLAMLYATEKDDVKKITECLLAHAAMVEEISAETWLKAYQNRGYLGAIELADSLGEGQRKTIWYLLIALKLAVSNSKDEAEFVLKKLTSSRVSQISSEQYFIAQYVLPVLLQTSSFSVVKNVFRQVLPQVWADIEFTRMSGHFFHAGRLDIALQAARSVTDPFNRAESLRIIALGLSDAQLFDEAEQVAWSISDQKTRVTVICNLARSLSNAKLNDKAEQLFVKAEQVARAIEVPMYRAQALRNIVDGMGQSHLFDEAIQIARSIEEPSFRTQAICKLALTLAAAEFRDKAEQMFTEAEKVAHATKDPESRSEALKTISIALTQMQAFDRAQDVARLIGTPLHRTQALRSVAISLAQAQSSKKAILAFREMKEAARSIKDPVTRVQALSLLFTALVKTNHRSDSQQVFEEIKQAARSIESRKDRSEELRRIVALLAQFQAFDQADEIASLIEDQKNRSKALKTFATVLAHTKDSERAKHVAHSIEDPKQRFDAFASINKVVTRSSTFESAEQVLAEAEQVSPATQDPKSRAHALKSLASALANASLLNAAEDVFTEAEKAAYSIEQLSFQTKTLCSLAIALSQQRLFARAERVTRYIRDPVYRAQALRVLASAMIKMQLLDKAKRLFNESEQVAWTTKSFKDRDRALRNIATGLANAELFHEAKNTARSIQDLEFRSQAFGVLASALAKAQILNDAKEFFAEAKKSARSIKNYRARASALIDVAMRLADARLFDEAERAARSIFSPKAKYLTLKNLATALAKAGFLQRSLQVARSIDDPTCRGHALKNIAAATSNAQLFSEAEQVARSIGDPESRAYTLKALAVALTKAGLISAALRITSEFQGDALLDILDTFATCQRVEGLKANMVRLSYSTHSALRTCAQMIQLHKNQAEVIYQETQKYRVMPSRDITFHQPVLRLRRSLGKEKGR